MRGLDSYSNGTKETWRGWQWNQIVKRLCGGKKLGPAATKEILQQKVVAYLVGPEDKDREIAIKKGFRSENLLAIDIDDNKVASVRKAGGIAISGSLQQILLEWPCVLKLDAVIGDFCGGFNNSFKQFADCLLVSKAVKKDTIISVNLLRGREPNLKSDLEGNDSQIKHRGVFALSYFYWKIQRLFIAELFAATGHVNCDCCKEKNEQRLIHSMNPVTYSYRSGNQYFDSVVFSHILNDSCDCEYCSGRNNIRKHLKPSLKKQEGKLRASIVANIAVHSRKSK